VENRLSLRIFNLTMSSSPPSKKTQVSREYYMFEASKNVGKVTSEKKT
jgi:hypothetical protein